MNKYQKILNRASNEALINYCLTVKLKYKDKWLKGGTPINHPIHIAYINEFKMIKNFRTIRKDIRKNCKTIEELNNLKRILAAVNAAKDFYLFKEDIKYN